jgi:hypothetical protein
VIYNVDKLQKAIVMDYQIDDDRQSLLKSAEYWFDVQQLGDVPYNFCEQWIWFRLLTWASKQ